jgi:hypothetical protein
MHLWQAGALTGAGVFAGFVGAVVGSGTLVTFPTLLWVGYSPIVANVSNGLGIVPGSITGVLGFRDDLTEQGPRLRRLVPACALGALGGAALLLSLPAAAFTAIVPVLIALAVVLVVVQPMLKRRLEARSRAVHAVHRERAWVQRAAAFGLGVYGGYFGGGLGIIALGVLAMVVPDDLRTVNAMKVVMVLVANLISGVAFIFVAHIAWLAVLFLAIGSSAGGWIGAKVGRRLSPGVLRGAIVVIGTAAFIKAVA